MSEDSKLVPKTWSDFRKILLDYIGEGWAEQLDTAVREEFGGDDYSTPSPCGECGAPYLESHKPECTRPARDREFMEKYIPVDRTQEGLD